MLQEIKAGTLAQRPGQLLLDFHEQCIEMLPNLRRQNVTQRAGVFPCGVDRREDRPRIVEVRNQEMNDVTLSGPLLVGIEKLAAAGDVNKR